MTPDLKTRVDDLYKSLAEFKAMDTPGQHVTVMYEALVGQAKKELPDDVVIAGIVTGRRSTLGGAMETAGDMRAVLQQILSALG